MEPILQINQIRSNDESTSSFRVTITQGSEIINSEEALRKYLIETLTFKKGIIEVTRESNNVWEIKTNK